MKALLPLALVLLLAACTTSIDPASSSEWTTEWRTEIAMTAPGKLGGCAVGDFDPQSPGHEIAAVSITGEVFLVRRSEQGWEHEVIATAPGELIQCVAGDVYPSRPGDELLVFGMAEGTEDDGGRGAAFLVVHTDQGWRLEKVLDDDALIHGGCILAPRERGPARLLLAGYGLKLFVLDHLEEGGWNSHAALTLDSPAKNIVEIYGGSAVIACADGKLLHVAPIPDPETWMSNVIDEAPAGQARLGASGLVVIAARDDGVLAIVDPVGGQGFENHEIYREAQKLRGAVLADVNPYAEGEEAATVGYEGNLVVLCSPRKSSQPVVPPTPADQGAIVRCFAENWRPWTNEGYVPHVLYTDTQRLHHLACGELIEESAGPELVACGYSGKLIVAGIFVVPATE